jgi:hyperpolarization activated cyclic nucleotide-gated potassium channel 2
VIETIIDITFMMDIPVQFNTGYYNKGNLINNRKDIIMNYLTSWFTIDLVASFPYGWLITKEDM